MEVSPSKKQKTSHFGTSPRKRVKVGSVYLHHHVDGIDDVPVAPEEVEDWSPTQLWSFIGALTSQPGDGGGDPLMHELIQKQVKSWTR